MGLDLGVGLGRGVEVAVGVGVNVDVGVGVADGAEALEANGEGDNRSDNQRCRIKQKEMPISHPLGQERFEYCHLRDSFWSNGLQRTGLTSRMRAKDVGGLN